MQQSLLLLLLSSQLQLLLTTLHLVVMCQGIQSLSWRKTKKLRHRLRFSPQRKITKKEWRKRALPVRERLAVLENADFDCYAETGLFYDQFLNLHARVKDALSRPRTGQTSKTVSLTNDVRLLMILNFLRDGGRYRRVALRYNVSRAYVCRELKHCGPILCASLSIISWPLRWNPFVEFEHVSGAIDCTPHFRIRTHPRQADFYRGDKHAFFWNAQVIVSLSGNILNVKLLMGHNNDQGSFNLTSMGGFLEREGLHWLADKGYHHHRLVRPDNSRSVSWNNRQKGLRSIVEVIIGLAKNFAFAAGKASMSPELHACYLIFIYELTEMNLQEFPIRVFPHDERE